MFERRAVVKNAYYYDENDYRRVAAYLPANYRIRPHTPGEGDGKIEIEGEDHAGWTLDEYVIPRLASGLLFANEI